MTKTFAVGVVLIAACHDVNPNYQPDGPGSGSNQIDAGSGSGSAPGCTTNAMCNGVTPICNTSAGGVCVACSSDADCTAPTGTCLPDGACDGDAHIAYVTMAGVDAGTCGVASPCKTISFALSTMKPYIVLTGKAMDMGVTIAQGVTILGRGSASITTSSGPVIAITDGDVELDDLLLSEGGTAGSGFGVVATGGGTLTIAHDVIQNCQAAGISVTGGRLIARRSLVTGNDGGGIVLTSASFTMENDIVNANGKGGAGGSPVGGISVLTSTQATDTIQFTTVANNLSADGLNGGIECLTQTKALTFSNDIIAGNLPAADPQTSGANCAYTYSDIMGNTVAGVGNGSDNPMLTPDFHLMVGSPAIDAADQAALLKIDYFGIARPQGSGYDMGAAEFKP